MPDADRFPPDLQPGAAPADWSAAFAALPQPTPPHGGWDRIAARLPAPRARAKWPLWLATAASLALVAGLPLTMRQSPDGSDPAPAASAALPAAAAPRDGVPASMAAVAPRVGEDGTVMAPTKMLPAPAMPANSTAAAARDGRPHTPARLALTSRGSDDTHASPSASQSFTSMPAVAANPLADRQLESARLEALLAMADDERVGSGTGAMLATQMQSRLAGIDSELASGALDDDARLSLWDARVQTLRELASLEATERWFAAEGRAFDTELVQVH